MDDEIELDLKQKYGQSLSIATCDDDYDHIPEAPDTHRHPKDSKIIGAFATFDVHSS